MTSTRQKSSAKITVKSKKESSRKKDINDISYILTELRAPLTVIRDAVDILMELHKEKPDIKHENLLSTIHQNLSKVSTIVDSLTENAQYKEEKMGEQVHLDIMKQIQQVCSTHDILFLQKQLHYHISASADLPKVYANPEKVLLVLSNLISNAVKYAPRGSDIELNIKEVSLRQGAGVEITITNASEEFTERDRYHIFEKFYNGKKADSTREGLGLAVCREIIQQSYGQLWVDIPTKGKVSFAFVLPCAKIESNIKVPAHHTFKYDITVANYEDIKTKFGAEKSQSLLVQIENSVRNLVRYPIDVVAAFEQSGIISTIYETQEGNASSVAARISQKLGSEDFHIGKDKINVTFQYRLSTLQ